MVPGVLFSHTGEQKKVLPIVLLSNQPVNQLPNEPIDLLADLTGILQEAQQPGEFPAAQCGTIYPRSINNNDDEQNVLIEMEKDSEAHIQSGVQVPSSLST